MTNTTEPLDITLQGAADRAPARFLVLRVSGVAPASGGLLGVRRSPSMPGWMPDAHVTTGTLAAGDQPGRAVRLHAPGRDVAGAAPGALLALGMVDDAHCICILRAPPTMEAGAVAAWAATQRCG
jgi:hypothetical protein